MNYICTWFCADEKGEESIFPQSGKSSSSKSHQDIYWRCLIVFYITSKKFNKEQKHLLFTNISQLPLVDGRNVQDLLEDLGVEVIHTDFKYKTPRGYFGMFQNQFYEFSILEYIAVHNKNPGDMYLILDSDCIFIKPAAKLFEAAASEGFISYAMDYSEDHVIHGISRKEMKEIYEELLEEQINEVPAYHLGEFYLASVENTVRIFNDFKTLWPVLLKRFAEGKKKFNEEAHTLSYLYYKNGFRPSENDTYIKRMWTNPVFHRNVKATDGNLTIWHLPAEKTFGLAALYSYLLNKAEYGMNCNDAEFTQLIKKTLGIPHLSASRKLEYLVVSYSRALKKRIINIKRNLSRATA